MAGLLLCCVFYQSAWIFSRTATAVIYKRSSELDDKKGYARGWIDAQYSVGYDIYSDRFLKDQYPPWIKTIEIRYLTFKPSVSRTNTFASIWGSTLTVFIIASLIITILFLRADIISNRAVFLLQRKSPFFTITQNSQPDYEDRVVDVTVNRQDEKLLFQEITDIETTALSADVRLSVYRLNPVAIGIFCVYAIAFFWSLISFLTSSFSLSTSIIIGCVLLFIPFYVKYTNNPLFKAKIPVEGALVFSSGGLENGGDVHDIQFISSAVVYLESFAGFRFRDRGTMGEIKVKSRGDNNKISYRCNEKIFDCVFIINNAKDYFLFKKLMYLWASKGVNVILKKAFEDEFVVQEMCHFKTPLI